jgi:parvulin-like peptidyl-prolyl isomerase
MSAFESSEAFNMKILAISLLASALLCGQAQQPPVKVSPGIPAVKAPPEPPQVAPVTPPPPVSPDTVVVEVDGRKVTAAELDKIIAGFPPNNQQAIRARPQLLSQVFLMQRLAEDAEKAGLDKQSPYREQLEANRLQLLSTAELSTINNMTEVPTEAQEKYYKENPEKFKEVKVRVIYIAFNPTLGKAPTDGKVVLTEAQAKAKIEGLATQIQGGGADFGKLARENSDDQASAARDGDFGVVKPDSAYPKEIKEAVFALKQGETGAPFKQGNGFYLIRAEEVNQQPYNDVLLQIIQTLRQAKYQEWFKGMQAQYNVKIENPAYFAPRAPAQLQQVH